ncbi:MAG: hypothetical protein L0Y44_02940 [Phycisphaerales bacterium]|nr:hypothetical protein [Phycisphaerales bacterium]
MTDRRPILKRWLRRTVIVGSLGLLTSIAVAWGLATSIPNPPNIAETESCFVRWDRAWHTLEWRRTGNAHYGWVEVRAETEYWTVDRLLAHYRDRIKMSPEHWRDSPPGWGTMAQPTQPHTGTAIDSAAGWPMLCLWDQYRRVHNGDQLINLDFHGSWLISGGPSPNRGDFVALPLRPLWLGLSANAAFYGALWSLAIFGPRTIRRTIRRRRGRCLACGYNLQANLAPGCPECGWNRSTPPPGA